MAIDFRNAADDFFVNLSLQTTLALPDSRETILHFCEAVRKEFPEMTSFYQRETGEFVLEGDRESGSYLWMELQARRLSAGYFNPAEPQNAYRLHRWLLDRCVYYLGISGIDVECLDILFGFNLDFMGNRDAIVADALLGGSALGAVLAGGSIPGKALECEPSIVLALDEECCMQARLSLETRSSSYQVRTGKFEDEPISVYLTLRRYPSAGKVINLQESFAAQCETIEDLTGRLIIPNIIQPIASAIASNG
jgi:hypothetical protein